MCFILMCSVLNTLRQYIYFYISKNIVSYTFLLILKIVESLQWILKVYYNDSKNKLFSWSINQNWLISWYICLCQWKNASKKKKLGAVLRILKKKKILNIWLICSWIHLKMTFKGFSFRGSWSWGEVLIFLISLIFAHFQ